jgi:phosphohistidine phosphatase
LLDDLYLATWQRMLDVLHTVPETARSVLLIGHNPGMHDLALELAGANAMARGSAPGTRRLAAGYPTAALAEFYVPSTWSGLDAGGARLVRFIAPNDLPEMAA